MRTCLVFALIYCLYHVDCTLGSCPPEVEESKHAHFFQGLCYRFVRYNYLFQPNAQKDCELLNGTLAVITNEKINHFIRSTMTCEYHNADDTWLGLSDQDHEGRFEWVGSKLSNYSNWAPGYGPEHQNSAQNCAVMSLRDGHWRDFWCSMVGRPYVCQYDSVESASSGQYTEKPQSLQIRQCHEKLASEKQQTGVPTTATDFSNTQAPTSQATTTQAPTTQAPTTEAKKTQPPKTQSTKQQTKNTPETTCPPFVCDLDCGMNGYTADAQGCSVCKCDE